MFQLVILIGDLKLKLNKMNGLIVFLVITLVTFLGFLFTYYLSILIEYSYTRKEKLDFDMKISIIILWIIVYIIVLLCNKN